MEFSLTTYLVAITLLTMTPGADTMMVLRNTLRGGAKDGWVSSVGICLGLFVHATLSAIGISAVLLYSATAFTLLKTIGACYLMWLGFSSLKSFWNARYRDETHVQKQADFHFSSRFKKGFYPMYLIPKRLSFIWHFCLSLSVLKAQPFYNRSSLHRFILWLRFSGKACSFT